MSAAYRGLRAAPHRMHASTGDRSGAEGWWYENANSIHVFMSAPGAPTMGLRIRRREIEDWLRRANAATARQRKA